MTNLSKVRIYFENEIARLDKVITNEKHISDHAPSAMESHSDTTNSQKEDLVNALEDKLKNLRSLVSTIPDHAREDRKIGLRSVVNIENIGQVLIVPEGLGGVKVDNLRLLSVSSTVAVNYIDSINTKY